MEFSGGLSEGIAVVSGESGLGELEEAVGDHGARGPWWTNGSLCGHIRKEGVEQLVPQMRCGVKGLERSAAKEFESIVQLPRPLLGVAAGEGAQLTHEALRPPELLIGGVE